MTPPSAADPDQVNRVIDSSEFHSAGGAENERVGPMSGIYHNQKVKIKIKNGEGGGCMASDGPRLNKAPKSRRWPQHQTTSRRALGGKHQHRPHQQNRCRVASSAAGRAGACVIGCNGGEVGGYFCSGPGTTLRSVCGESALWMCWIGLAAWADRESARGASNHKTLATNLRCLVATWCAYSAISAHTAMVLFATEP